MASGPMKATVLTLSLSLLPILLLSGCGATTPATSADPADALDLQVSDASAEARAVLGFLNDEGTDAALLDGQVGLDSRAAKNLIAHRDGADGLAATADDDAFDTIAEIDAVKYVGPVALEHLRAYVDLQGWLTYAGGTFDGVQFDDVQVTIALDLVNAADFSVLDVDASLDSRAANGIIAARPILSMDALAQVEWVGPATLRRLRSFLPTWQERGMTLEVYDGVAFTHLDAARALAAANQADLATLATANIRGAQANLLLSRRPWPSLEAVAKTTGIGPLTMARLRTLGDLYPNAPLYIVNGSDAMAFAAEAKTSVEEDDSFYEQMTDLLSDLTGDSSWPLATAQAIAGKIETRIDGFSSVEVGRTYSSLDAARKGFHDYAHGLTVAAITDYPTGALTFTGPAADDVRLSRAKQAIVYYWMTVEVYDPSWQANVGLGWDAVKDDVKNGAAAFETTVNWGVWPQDGGAVIFSGTVDQLPVEVTVDPIGKVTKVSIELD